MFKTTAQASTDVKQTLADTLRDSTQIRLDTQQALVRERMLTDITDGITRCMGGRSGRVPEVSRAWLVQPRPCACLNSLAWLA